MQNNLRGAAWRFAFYAVMCLSATVLLFAIFDQLRIDKTKTYNAVFTNVSEMKEGDFVRVGGVEVGKIKTVSVNRDATVRVEFSVDDSVALTDKTNAVVRYDDLVGGRYMALKQGDPGGRKLNPGDTIALAQTQPALDLDALVGGFRPLLRALNPDQVNALTGQLISAFQGEGATINSFLDQTAALTSTLADRDQLIGQVIGNLNVVLGSLGDQKDQFANAVDSLSELVKGLAAHKQDISNGVAYVNAAAGSIADLLTQARPPLTKVVHEADRTAGQILADKDYVDNLLNTLPDAYQLLGRQGLYGDFFNFYLCDIVLKVNGKGGQPVYVKLAGQTSGRCQPR